MAVSEYEHFGAGGDKAIHGWDGPTEGDSLPPRSYDGPSMHGPKGGKWPANIDLEGLVLRVQLLEIALAGAMEQSGATYLMLDRAEVHRLRMAKLDIQEDEGERIEVRRES